MGEEGGRFFHTVVVDIINRIRLPNLRDVNCL